LALSQVEAAAEGARRAEQPEKPVFVIGFLGGQEVVWLPHALRIIREEAPGVEIMLSSQSSPELALTLMRGKMYSRAPFRSSALLLSKPGRGALSSGRWTRRGYRSAPYIHNIVNAELWVRVMAAPPVRKECNERRSLRFDRNQVQARKGSAPDENIFQHR
jgi:hypothetical protein